MGRRSIFKYLNLFSLALNLMTRLSAWYADSTDEESEGGENITSEEWAELANVVAQAILDTSGMVVEVLIAPSEPSVDAPDVG